jgi:VIT1/CCC1 family predicted Fe2+/Mn2+ transporter
MIIQQNQSTLDRFARIILGGIMMIATSYIAMPSAVVFVIMVTGLYLMFSGLSGHCFIYQMFGVNTCK